MKNNLSESILTELEENNTNDIKSLAKSVEDILKQCNAEVSYVDYSEVDNKIDINCSVKPDSISKTENNAGIYGTLAFDENLKLVSADLKTGSGPNILNYNFIRCLDALYSYFSSGNNNYNL